MFKIIITYLLLFSKQQAEDSGGKFQLFALKSCTHAWLQRPATLARGRTTTWSHTGDDMVTYRSL